MSTESEFTLKQMVAARVERELKDLLDNAPEALHWLGRDGTILWANQTELALLGYAPGEYIGRQIAEFHVDVPVIKDILARLSRGETLDKYEARLRRKDGSIRLVQINSNVLWRDGEFLHARCFTRDVTDRRADHELATRLADIVENSEDAILSHDLDGLVTSWNPAAERLYGYSAAAVKGRPIGVIIPSDREAEEAEVIARVCRGERVPPFDTIRRRADGSLIPVSLTVSPMRDHSGRVIGASKTARDISEQHRLEARDRLLLELEDSIRALSRPEDITLRATTALGRHLGVNRCAYATVEADQDTFELTDGYSNGVDSIVGRYTFRQFSEECLRLMLAGEPYVVEDSETDPRVTPAERPAYVAAAIRAVICVPIFKEGRFVAAMSVHSTTPRSWLPLEVEQVRRVASRCWESMERARVTQTLAESEQQFRALANSIANLAWMAHPDGWIYWYNDQWYAYTGTTPAEMEGWGWERVHHPDTLDNVKARWQASIASGTAFEMVFPIRGADGQFRRFLTRVNPVTDSAGQVRHWFGTNTDVHNEWLARKEAELQKQLLHDLFMQAPISIAVLRGPTHIVELANPPLLQAWGHDAEAVLQRSFAEVLPEMRSQGFMELLDDAYQTGTPHAGKETPVDFTRTSGVIETIYLNWVYLPFRNVDDVIDGIFIVASDVTEQVLARNQVNAANRAKDEFLAMLGHELRNPLSPIVTALHLMTLRGGTHLERERAMIERQVTHLTRLVDDLLDVSRIAGGKIALKREVIDISEVLSRAIELTTPLLERGNHVLTLDVANSGLAVDADPTRLTQIVSNILTNAAKYTPPGGRVHVDARADNGQIVLSIRDTGIGMSPEVIPTVFDLFVQNRQDIDRSQGGLGLGLAIVRNLVESHGGTVTAHSEGVGKGSEFVVRLPQAAAVRPAAGGADSPGRDRGSVPEADRVRVLVVDDNHDSADALALALRAHGCDAAVAHDGPTALAVAAQFGPTVAVLDIGLPVMDGYELAQRLRQLAGLRDLRLIALTGYGQPSDREQARRAGFDAHLVKPVAVEKLYEIVTAVSAPSRS